MGNPNHDPKTGEFSSGEGGSAGADHGRIDQSRGISPGGGSGGTAGMDPVRADQLRGQNPGNFSVAEKRAMNQMAFRDARFSNKLAGAGDPQTTFNPPFPEVSHLNLTASQRDAMMKAANKLHTKK